MCMDSYCTLSLLLCFTIMKVWAESLLITVNTDEIPAVICSLSPFVQIKFLCRPLPEMNSPRDSYIRSWISVISVCDHIQLNNSRRWTAEKCVPKRHLVMIYIGYCINVGSCSAETTLIFSASDFEVWWDFTMNCSLNSMVISQENGLYSCLLSCLSLLFSLDWSGRGLFKSKVKWQLFGRYFARPLPHPHDPDVS